MTLVLDTGALIAFDRGDRRVAALVEATRRADLPVTTSSGCVAQAWRARASQVLLARLLRGVDERALDPGTARRIGALCADTASNDVVDAHVALLAATGDVVVTSDPADLKQLLRAGGVRARVERC